MPISDYLRGIREKVGSDLLIMPGVSMACFDEQGRLLMADHGGKKGWAIPGGSVDPEDNVADTAVREMLEEANLRVEPIRVIGIYGGPDFLTTYPNGDQVDYKDACIACRVISGELKPDGDEIAALRFFEPEVIQQMDLYSWMSHILPDVLNRENGGTKFPPVTWKPPADGIRTGGIPNYVRNLRTYVGTQQIMMCGAAALVRNAGGQILMQRRSDNGLWSLPGGAIDPHETPTDAAVREVWEETGLLVEPTRVAGLFGGEEGFVTYPNGDQVAIFSFVFECAAGNESPTIDHNESLEVRYFGEGEVLTLDMAPRLKRRLSLLFQHKGPDAYFDPSIVEP